MVEVVRTGQHGVETPGPTGLGEEERKEQDSKIEKFEEMTNPGPTLIGVATSGPTGLDEV